MAVHVGGRGPGRLARISGLGGLDRSAYLDFQFGWPRSTYWLDGGLYTDFTSVPGATSTGGAGFGMVQRNGVWQSVAANAPLIGDGGLGVWEARTNSIRNPTALGAALPALPTNWSVGVPAGITVTPVGRGVEGGLPYIDFQFSGTNNSGGTLFPNVTFEVTDVVCAAGETWTISCFGKLISGALPGGCALLMQQRASGAFVTNAGPAMSFGATLAETRGSAAMSATVNQVRPLASFTWPNLATATFVVRFAAPNLKLGPDINDPPILQTTGLPATRTAVAQSVSGLVLPGGDFDIEQEFRSGPAGAQSRAFQLHNGTDAERLLAFISTTGAVRGIVTNAGVSTFFGTAVVGEIQPFSLNKITIRRRGLQWQIATNDVLSGEPATAAVPDVNTVIFGRNRGADDFLNGTILRHVVRPA